MYLINQVSKLTGLTKKALRYYDEQKILCPSFRDKENGYRMYDEADLKKARLISLMRQYDFSISEIKDSLLVAQSEEDLTYIFREKIEMIEQNIAKEKELISKIKMQLEPVEPDAAREKYEITIERTEPFLAAGLRIRDAYDQVGKYMPELFKSVKGNACGTIFNCYYDDSCVEIADMEICVPVKKQILGGNVKSHIFPEIQAVCTTHYGRYDDLTYAYQTLFQYINANGLSVTVPSREVYIKGPGMIFKGNPEKYVTKILIPFV